MKEPDTIISISPAEFNKIPLFKSLNYEDLEDILFKCALFEQLRGPPEDEVLEGPTIDMAGLHQLEI